MKGIREVAERESGWRSGLELIVDKAMRFGKSLFSKLQLSGTAHTSNTFQSTYRGKVRTLEIIDLYKVVISRETNKDIAE